jgi:NodT family efflux transporter outer membrane factor (OMF) lipoprotein
MSRTPRMAAVAALALLAGCALGPDYERPDAPTPVAYKEQDGWKPSLPQDSLERGPWWAIYHDPVLDGLEKRIEISNQTLRASEAAYRQSRAIVDVARASFFPTISASASQTYTERGAGHGSVGGSQVAVQQAGGSSFLSGAGRGIQSESNLSLDGTWSLDVWGRIRRTVESDVANAEASAADLASARLSAQATLASDYFQLRTQDELKRLLDRAVVDYHRSFEIAQNQYNVGVAAKADVLSAQTQLLSAEAQAINAGVQRAQLEHAIAVLIGAPAADFTITPIPLDNTVPTVPAGVPSTLLERRPDVAASERRMASANAEIGVAIAAFFPDLTLSGSLGYSSSNLTNLLEVANRTWSLGPSLAETVFDAGARSAELEQARDVYDENVANYRQTVLTAFQQVEDALANLRILEQQAAKENEVVAAAQEAERLTLNQYKAGTVPYSSVITAQTAALSNEETALTVLRSRLTESVALVQALGGGWTAGRLPTRDEVEDDAAPRPIAATEMETASTPAP